MLLLLLFSSLFLIINEQHFSKFTDNMTMFDINSLPISPEIRADLERFVARHRDDLVGLMKTDKGQREMAAFFTKVSINALLGMRAEVVKDLRGMAQRFSPGVYAVSDSLRASTADPLEHYGYGIYDWYGQVQAFDLDHLIEQLGGSRFRGSDVAAQARQALIAQRRDRVVDPRLVVEGLSVKPRTDPLTTRLKQRVLEAHEAALPEPALAEYQDNARRFLREYIGKDHREFDPYFWLLGLWLIPNFIDKVRAEGLTVHELLLTHCEPKPFVITPRRAVSLISKKALLRHRYSGPEWELWEKNQFIVSNAAAHQVWQGEGMWFHVKDPRSDFVPQSTGDRGSHWVVAHAPDAMVYGETGGNQLYDVIAPGPIPPSLTMMTGTAPQLQAQLAGLGGISALRLQMMRFV